MVIFLLLCAIPGCFSCNAHRTPKNRAKMVEEYVVSAKFDENKNLPQLGERNLLEEIYQEEKRNPLRLGSPKAKNSSLLIPSISRESHINHRRLADDFEDKNTLEERDLLVHHHHLPPLSHPPPPVELAYAPSLFAVGLITFLILLNSLQASYFFKVCCSK